MRKKVRYGSAEFKVVAVRDCAGPEGKILCDTPQKAVSYWKTHIRSHPYFTDECECMAALILNSRRRVEGHHLVAVGTLDGVVSHPREVFRAAVIQGASAVVLMHNHPSGDPSPSEADVRITRELIRAGQILKIDVCDHIIVGSVEATGGRDYVSLRELGFFCVKARNPED